MVIKLKSIREPADSTDGIRILISRFRPRFVKKENENWDIWNRELAPSKQLWFDYIKSKTIDWNEYKKRFIEEMKSNPKSMGAIRWLLLLSDNNNVTLICFCKDESKCHRSLVRDLALKEDRLCVKKAQNANVIMDD